MRLDPAIGKAQRVRRAGYGRLGRFFVRQREGLKLERCRHVAAAAALGDEPAQRGFEPVDRRLCLAIGQILPGLGGKARVDQG
ncbi:hypothetical protein GCM10011319_37900 [Mameliella alba]|nr:hypothetical protein GCM10011319_37900 [Mameliella alba]